MTAVARTMLMVYVATLFISSLLMFLLEPMAAKMVLPLLGGAPAVWNTCVVFFQAMLLFGYAYAHGAPRGLGVKRHAAGHAMLVLLPLVALPFAIGSSTAAERHPVVWLLMLLLTSIGLPFFVLTTTAPLLQKWFSRTDHPAAQDPYFLYAASNLGSLAGLVLYPGLVEPSLRLREQSRAWTLGYAAFAVLAVACAAFLWNRADRAGSAQADEVPSAAPAEPDVVTSARRLRWVLLSFAPSSLMLAVTTFVSTDIAAVPLLWIVPLALYLLTFVMAFSSSQRYPRALVDRGLPLLLLPLVFMMMLRVTGPFAVVLPVHLLVFFLSALLCHRALAENRPSAAHLTEFYLWVATGGVLGSLFNTLAAPALFTGIAEYPLVLVLVCLLRTVPEGKTGREHRGVNLGLAVAAGVLTLAILWAGADSTVRFALVVPAFLCLRVSRTRVPFALAIGLMLLGSAFQRDQYGKVLHAERTFFGTYRVRTHPTGRFRSLFHGTTLHGMQSVAPERRGEPLTYYHRTGPFGELYGGLTRARTDPQIAVVGLGVGSLATYRQPDQQWTFYEIDPAVERIARTPSYFTYLGDCGSSCRVVIGDARLSLTAARDARYGLIVLDAFSSDAIPVHLMTREALQLYVARLAPDGALAFHISNRHLQLEPVLARLAEELGLVAVTRRDRIPKDESADGKTSSDWLVMARSSADLGGLAADGRWMPSKGTPGAPVWTDDFSNILSVLAPR